MSAFGDLPVMEIGTKMAISFVFWWGLSFVIGGPRYTAALLGAAVSGVTAAMGASPNKGNLTDNLGVVSTKSPYYTTGRSTTGFNFGSAAVSAVVTFVVWYVVGMFVIGGSPWKYASTAAVIAAVGGAFNI